MSSYPLATIFHGDVTIEEGSDYTQFGYGDLNVYRKLIVNGIENSTGSPSVGSVLISGGVKIDKSLHVHGDLNVLYDQTRLTETHIDTTNGPTTITGGNKVDIRVGTTSNFITTSGDLSMYSSAGSLQLYGGKNSILAIDIIATNSNGGITMMSGVNGGIDIGCGSGNFIQTVSNGNTTLTTNNGVASFTVNSAANNQDININLTGNTDSQLKLESSGTNISKDAILINTTDNSGSIVISNKDGLGSGYLKQFAGSGGYQVLTNTSGSISIVAQAATSDFLIKTNNVGDNMTIGLENCTDSSLIIKSSGTNLTNRALVIQTTCENGSIYITNPTHGSTGGINLFAAAGGSSLVTSRGSTSITTYGGSTSLINNTITNGEDINIIVNGETNSKINISSDSSLTDAINMNTSNSGGILLYSEGVMSLQSENVNDGIKIGTDNIVPISIGKTTSTTTINGNLIVKGTTTTVDSEIVTIVDNIIVVNNTPLAGSDGGMAIKRYQNANNDGSGDVVADTPDVTGNCSNGGTITDVILDSNASSTNNEYNGWWIKLYKSSTNSYQVRRIKSYDGVTKTATIYSTNDQTFTLGNPIPIEGLNLDTPPNSDWSYSLYPCHYVLNIWDESNNQFALMCGSESPTGMYEFAHYTDLRLNKLIAQEVNTTYINGSLADITTEITLNDDSTSSVVISDFPTNYGVYLVFVKPKFTTSRSHAIFMVGRVDLSTKPGTIVRIISVRGINDEQLDMQWLADSKPEIFYRYKPGTISNTEYKIKIVSL